MNPDIYNMLLKKAAEMSGAAKSEYEEPKESSDSKSEGNVSSKLIGMIHDQIAHEAYNAHLYLKIATNLENMGLDNIAKHFHGQFEEENEHQAKFSEYLTDRNENVVMNPTPAVDVNPTDITDIAEKYLKQEQLTTKKIKDIAKVAWDEWDLLTFNFLEEMLKGQHTEEKEALTFRDQVKFIGSDKSALLLWNMNFKL